MQTLRFLLTTLLSVALLGTATAQEDKTLSPYFVVKSDDPENDRLPLRSTKADVTISGVIADVTVTQVYKNDGKNPLECIYVFPGSTRAAVYGMKMTIGSRTIEAEIREKQKAREEYEQAKQEGKRASLLEQQRPNVFQMNVANIMPGDVIKVELKYTELLVPTDGVYEFVYPTVVGPRFSDKLLASANPEDKFVASSYTKEGVLPMYHFGINVRLNAGMPIQDIKVNTHKTFTTYPNVKTANIKLDDSEMHGGNRDYILRYKLQGGEIESGLLLFEGEKENFFLMMVQPPKKVEPKNIPPREYIFIVDISGSMRGFPLNTSKKLLRNLIVNLRPTDKFNVLLFAGSAQVLGEESVLATEENIQRAIDVIDNKRGGGGTQLLPAMRKALALPRSEGLSRSMVIVTDGYVSCEPEAFELIRNNLNKSNLFSFGIGSSVNRHLIDGLAHVGMGEPLVVTGPEGADEKAENFRQYISSPVLTQVDVDFSGFGAYDVEPVAVPDVLAERPVIVYGKYRGEAKGSITLKGYAGGRKKYKKTFAVSKNSANPNNEALRYLWARKRIERLDDHNKLRPWDTDKSIVAEVTQLGLDYNLMTAYTSFIAVDKEVVNKDGKLVTTKQALPLPQGVSNAAVGFDMSIAGASKSTKKIAVAKTSLVVTQITSAGSTLQKNRIKLLVQRKMKGLNLILNNAVQVKLTLDAKGNVKEVVLNGSKLSTSTRNKLNKALQSWTFNTVRLNDTMTVEFTIQATS